MTSIRIEGTEVVIENLNKIMPQVRASLKAGALVIKDKIAKYPPQAPHVKYVRTGDLGRGWFVKDADGEDFAQIISSGANTPYAPYVQDIDMQARWMRPLGWIPAQTIAENNMGEIVKEIQRAIDKL